MERLKQIPGVTNLERRDFLYSNIEDKIGVIRKVWNIASNLPNPSGSDNKDTVEGEKAAFQTVLDEASEQLVRDDGFTTVLDRGIGQALLKRSIMRDSLRRVVDVTSPQAWDWVLELDQELEIFSGNVQRVVIKPFSVNLIVKHEAVQRCLKTIGSPAPLMDATGFHISEHFYNIIDDEALEGSLEIYRTIFEEEEDPEQQEKLRYLLGSNEAEWEDSIYRHEDFHSFAEYLPLKPIFNFNGAVDRLVLEVKNGEKEKGSTRKMRDELLNAGHGELAAALASLNLTRVAAGSVGSFANAASNKKQLLENAIYEESYDRNLLEDVRLISLLYALDGDLIDDFISGCYQEVAQNAPLKARDLDLALVLFPPSQWKHVGKLVNRWTKQQAS